MTDTAPEAPQDAPVEAVGATQPQPTPTDTPEADDDGATAPDDRDAYIEQLKAEIIEKRHRAKKVDTANERLLSQVLAADGRLIDESAIPLGPELLDADGLVDPAKVRAAVDALVAVKPWVRKQVPTAPLPGQGVTTAPPEPTPGLFDVFLGR